MTTQTANANRTRGKGAAGSVPITGELVWLHSDSMHEEYGILDCTTRS